MLVTITILLPCERLPVRQSREGVLSGLLSSEAPSPLRQSLKLGYSAQISDFHWPYDQA